VTTADLRQLVEGVRFVEQCLLNPVDKDAEANTLRPLRDTFGKSVVASQDLPDGVRLRREHLAVKKPGTGIPPNRLRDLIGKRLLRALVADEQLRKDDVDRDAS
jgi:sialic acid synthase SpsE